MNAAQKVVLQVPLLQFLTFWFALAEILLLELSLSESYEAEIVWQFIR